MSDREFPVPAGEPVTAHQVAAAQEVHTAYLALARARYHMNVSRLTESAEDVGDVLAALDPLVARASTWWADQ